MSQARRSATPVKEKPAFHPLFCAGCLFVVCLLFLLPPRPPGGPSTHYLCNGRAAADVVLHCEWPDLAVVTADISECSHPRKVYFLPASRPSSTSVTTW